MSAAPLDSGERGVHRLDRRDEGPSSRLRRRHQPRPVHVRHAVRRRPGTRAARAGGLRLRGRERRRGAGAAARLPDPCPRPSTSRSGSRGGTRAAPDCLDGRRQAHADRRPRQPGPLRDLEHAVQHSHAVGGRRARGRSSRSTRTSAAPTRATSADAAGLAILPGLIRYDEVYGPDPIRHAFRFTVRSTNGYVYPASHRAGSTSGAPPMGTRLRLKASKNIFRLSRRHAEDLPGDEDVRPHRGRQRLRHVRPGNVRHPLEQRCPESGVLRASQRATSRSSSEAGSRRSRRRQVGRRASPLAPCRVVDTRNAAGPYGGPAIPAGNQRVFRMTGQCGIPATAKAVSGNVTAVTPLSDGAFQLFSGDDQPGVATTVSFVARKTRANNVVLKISGSGSGALGVASTAFGTCPSGH